MNIGEIAFKYDVPLPQTSEELDWKNSTNYKWLGKILCKQEICDGRYILKNVIDNTLVSDTSFECGINAPNAQELLDALPKIIRIKYRYYYGQDKIGDFKLSSSEDVWFYELLGARFHEVVVYENRLAQAFASMHMLLKEVELLPIN